MADFVEALDLRKLIVGEALLTFAISMFNAPPYNLPLFLFGLYAHDATEYFQSLQLFAALLGVSFIYDIVWMAEEKQNGFILFMSIVIIILKVPTIMASILALRHRGTSFSGLGLRGGDLTGPTVWSMPGGFTSGGRDGYQSVDDEPHPHSAKPNAVKSSQPEQSQAPTTHNAYQSV